ncbi:MAG TPA: M48 family metalloprotease, partial [Terriglobales bacterium]
MSIPSVPGKIMFDQQQEGYLADAIIRNYNATNRVIELKQLNEPLQKIGARLVQNVRGLTMRPEFTLIDLPQANAFTFPGGHIYVTKKLVGITRSEDELAGVLGHELGHALTKQIARDYTEMWKSVLEIDSVAGKEDIEEKYNRFLETYATNPKALRSAWNRVDQEQSQADDVGILLAVRAGYEPKAFADFFDRLAETRGKKGNWFSDVFGLTRANGKRLREIIKNTVPAPSGCGAQKPIMTAAEYAEWRQKVVAYSGFGKEESLPPATVKRVLADPLQSEIRNLQFSPDGKYILAQDAASIYVMTREPFANLFRIDSEKAYDAKFTPDSKAIVFETEDERIERWGIEQQEQENSYELHIRRACMQSELSPTGEYLACLQLGDDGHVPLQLAVLDVASGEEVWAKKAVVVPTFGEMIAIYLGSRFHILLEFSPDGRYVAGSGTNGQFAYDLNTKQSVELGKARDYMKKEFVFTGEDTILGVAGGQGEKSAIVKFPSGDLVKNVDTGFGTFYRVAKGPLIIIRPTLHAAAAVLNYDTSEFVISSRTRAIDVYENSIVSELINGKLGLFHSPKDPPYAVLELPKGPLPQLNAVAVSGDSRYVAYSDLMRGAIWDTSNGARVSHVRGFRGAYFGADHELYTDFPAPDSYFSKGMNTKD